MPAATGTTSEPSFAQYSTFLHPTFEADAFAHAVLKGDEYPPREESSTSSTTELGPGFMKGLTGENGTGDVSAALARLNFGVEDLNRQLKSEITKHHSSLLLQAASLGGMDGDLAEVKRGLSEVEAGVSRLHRKIALPYESLASSLLMLTRVRRAASLARRAQRFVVLARRLEGQMAEIDRTPAPATLHRSVGSTEERGTERRERAMAEAALTLADIETLLNAGEGIEHAGEGIEHADDDPEAVLPIRTLDVVESNLSAVEMSRERVVEEMQTSVQKGLTDLDQPLLASSLQTSYNLSVLPSLVDSLVADLNELVYRKVKSCFDMAALAREIGTKETPASAASAFVYKSRTRNEPTQANLHQWTSTMWNRLEHLVNDMGNICIKVYTLEKVLTLKKDQMTQTSFLDEAMTVLENKPSVLFWTSLAQAFETQAKEAVRSSTFVQTLLSTGYPRLLRLFQEFFSKIAVHTDTVYTLAHQSPETVLVLRSIQPFETLYLTRSTNRLTESVSSAFSISSSLAASFTSRPPTAPTANEGLATARAIVNELDAARFDPILVKAVAKGASRAIESFMQRAESLVAHDHSATSLLGPLATPSQHNNADLTSSLYHLWHPLERVLQDHTDSVQEILKPSIDRVRGAYLAIVNPLIMSIRREFSTLLARMHRVDYSKETPEPNSVNGPMTNPGTMAAGGGGGGGGGGGASGYMHDLNDKLSFVKEEILANYRVGQLGKDWALDLARFTVQTFLLHASIVQPLGESGKLKLTQDTTALEFSINQYLSGYDISLQDLGDQFKALRAFRPLLFLDTESLLNPTLTTSVPTLILLHHLISRSPVPLPHQHHGWTRAEYVRWLNEHGESDRVGMIEQVSKDWQQQQQHKKGESIEGGDDGQLGGEEQVWLDRIQTILDRTRS
ncbi:uncharacterized protein JCM15063_002108 [Sporobolomyces koalae]|uniref:uncharacterized protein n=1 Tax=Sporobolomyces koalae TaxID=500713 RepID=UPI00317F62F5